jgi:hypothetical protein
MIFDDADIFLFCSAAISRRVMEADPMNIVHCPYSIFVAEMDGEVMIGHRAYPDGPMQEVEAMLDSIILDARGRHAASEEKAEPTCRFFPAFRDLTCINAGLSPWSARVRHHGIRGSQT